MIPAASKARSGTKYLYYRCINEDCIRKKKSVRAKVIFDFINKVLEDGITLSDKDYEEYRKRLVTEADRERLTVRTEVNSKKAALKATKRRIKSIGTKIIDYDKKSRVWQINNEQLTKLESEEKDLQEQITELESIQNDPEKEALSIKQFLNLAKNAGSKVKAADEVGKDHISQLIFLNLVVDEQKVVAYHLKEPFKTALQSKIVLNGRGERTRTSDLTVPNRAR